MRFAEIIRRFPGANDTKWDCFTSAGAKGGEGARDRPGLEHEDDNPFFSFSRDLAPRRRPSMLASVSVLRARSHKAPPPAKSET